VVGLRQGVDAAKDQSYVLAVLTQTQLQHTLLPVGEWTKEHVRALAREWGLPVASRPDSQDLCFLGGDDYRDFLRRHRPDAVRPGPIFTVEGRRIGTHQGLAFYTIGQRRGLGVSAGQPLYVVDKDPARNALIVGPRAALGRRVFWATAANWIWRAPAHPFRARVKIRYRARLAPATVYPEEQGRGLRVVLDEPLRDITPGQAVVAYVNDWVVVAGTIVRAAAA
jgi:tRNA-specific 2-thiouridylase